MPIFIILLIFLFKRSVHLIQIIFIPYHLPPVYWIECGQVSSCRSVVRVSSTSPGPRAQRTCHGTSCWRRVCPPHATHPCYRHSGGWSQIWFCIWNFPLLWIVSVPLALICLDYLPATMKFPLVNPTPLKQHLPVGRLAAFFHAVPTSFRSVSVSWRLRWKLLVMPPVTI